MNEQLNKWKNRAQAAALWTKHQVEARRIRETTVAAVPHLLSAALVGLFAVIYAKLFLFCEHFIFSQYSAYPWLAFIGAPLAFLISWWLVLRFAPAAAGSGIPQLMAAAEIAQVDDDPRIEQLLGLKTSLVKVISSCICILGGGAIGREGPTLQLAGSTFYLTNKLLRRTASRLIPKASLQSMIITGGAAGLAAAFNTPLGGIVYAVEELAKVHLSYFRTSLIQAVIVSGLVAQVMLGPYLYLGLPNVRPAELYQLPIAIAMCAVIGVLGALAGRFLFSLGTWRSEQNSKKQAVIVVLLGLAFATMLFLLGLTGLGSGKDVITDLLFSDRAAEWTWPISRFLGNLFSYASGGAGGIFAPALATGATLGSCIAKLTPNVDPHLFILLGMIAFLTGVTRTPFTSFVLVLEMTDRHTVIFSMMIGAMSANAAAYLVDSHSLYERMKNRFVPPADVSHAKKFE